MQSTLPVIAVNGVIGAQVSPLDRGFTYGDGVFETCKMVNGKIPLWKLHKERLVSSSARLLIPIAIDDIEQQLADFISAIDVVNAVVKITITRGEGGRGYKLPDSAMPTIVIGIFPEALYPDEYFSAGITVTICNQRLSCNSSLAGLKHLNRLEQILARTEWSDNTIAEGILFDVKNNLIEGVFSNIFLVKNNKIFTPDLSESGVEGIMRRLIIEDVAPAISHHVNITSLAKNDLLNADEIFLCNSQYGIWPVRKIWASEWYTGNIGVITSRLQQALIEILRLKAL